MWNEKLEKTSVSVVRSQLRFSKICQYCKAQLRDEPGPAGYESHICSLTFYQWLKCNRAQGNTVPLPTENGSRRCPPQILWTQENGKWNAMETESALTVYSYSARFQRLSFFCISDASQE